MGTFAAITVFFAIIGLVIWANAALRAKRVAELKEFAAHNGFTWNDRDASWVHSYKNNFQFFKHGTSHQFRDFLHKAAGGRRICIFQFSYVTGSGKSRTIHIQTILMFAALKTNLPQFLLEPENIIHKIGELFGSKDIDFPENPIFSSKYNLKGDDTERIAGIFNIETRSFFEQNLGWSIEAHGDAIIVFRQGKKWPVKDLISLLHFGEKVLEMFRG